MSWSLDARIPLTLVTDETALAAALATGPAAAILAEAPPPTLPQDAIALVSFDWAMPHAVACGCCGGRSAVATALDRLFQARVKGATGWFQRVIAFAPSAEAQASVLAALREDAVTLARFRTG
jgi:hypothetical protein